MIAAYAIPSFIIEMKDYRARIGEKAKFKCRFSGNPQPGKEWVFFELTI
jgi:hypothetical protein